MPSVTVSMPLVLGIAWIVVGQQFYCIPLCWVHYLGDSILFCSLTSKHDKLERVC